MIPLPAEAQGPPVRVRAAAERLRSVQGGSGNAPSLKLPVIPLPEPVTINRFHYSPNASPSSLQPGSASRERRPVLLVAVFPHCRSPFAPSRSSSPCRQLRWRSVANTAAVRQPFPQQTRRQRPFHRAAMRRAWCARTRPPSG